MKTRKTVTQGIALLSAVLFMATVLPTSNGQVVVEDTNVEVLDVGIGTPSPYQVTIFQTANSTPGDFTDVLFGVEPITVLIDPPTPVPPNSTGIITFASLTGIAVALDEGADLYVAQAGDLFSNDTINSGNFQPLVEDASLSSAIVGPGDFFLAISTTGTDSGFPPLGADRNVFGWARLNVDDQANITLLDNAVAYGTGNIIVGQNAFAVPEPSSGIVLVALFGLGVARRRKC